ncbi:hypothetical protein ACMU9U_000849 [Yersinia enterocolitica]
MNEPRNNFWDNTFLLALAPIGGYFFVYRWFAGKADYYHYPRELIEINLTSGLSLFSITVLILSLALCYWYILNKTIVVDSNNQEGYEKIEVILISLFILMCILSPTSNILGFDGKWYQTMIAAIAFMTLMKLIGRFNKFLFKVTSLRRKFFLTRNNYVMVLLSAFILSKIIYDMSYVEAKNKKDYFIMHVADKNYGVIDIYSNTYILAALENNQLTKSLVIYRADSGAIIPIENKKLTQAPSITR